MKKDTVPNIIMTIGIIIMIVVIFTGLIISLLK